MRIEEQNGRRYVMLTKIVRVPVEAVVSIRPAANGGSLLVTDRGASVVCERYEDLLAALNCEGLKIG